jgi:hypothetical protein
MFGSHAPWEPKIRLVEPLARRPVDAHGGFAAVRAAAHHTDENSKDGFHGSSREQVFHDAKAPDLVRIFDIRINVIRV